MCDSKRCFLFCSIGFPGSCSDHSAWENTEFQRLVEKEGFLARGLCIFDYNTKKLLGFVVETIVINLNSYIDQWKLKTPTADTWRRKNDCTPITSGDVYQFIAILYYMGIVRLASKDDYWSTHDWVPSNHPVCAGMSRNRFRLFIWRFFHVNHNDNNNLQASFVLNVYTPKPPNCGRRCYRNSAFGCFKVRAGPV